MSPRSVLPRYASRRRIVFVIDIIANSVLMSSRPILVAIFDIELVRNITKCLCNLEIAFNFLI